MLTVEKLTKAYDIPRRAKKKESDVGGTGARRYAIQDVSFELVPGEMFTLLGPSGCGKTTTLRSVAGLETPNDGAISVAGRTLYDGDRRINVAANDRGLGMVFQSYAIWPHMSVFDNVAFPLQALPRTARPGRTEIRERVESALQATALGDFAGRSATALSGGQQQRLALARALVVNPQLLLLDEPLSNLDAKLRESMRVELKRLQRDYGLTCVYVTHDQDEALTLSDRIAVMNEGRIVQIGSPNDVYDRPASHFVADFIGATTFLEGIVVDVPGSDLSVDTAAGRLTVSGDDHNLAAGAHVTISIRPEWVRIVPLSEPGSLEAEVITRTFRGDAVEYLLRVGDVEVKQLANPVETAMPGDRVGFKVPADRCIIVR